MLQTPVRIGEKKTLLCTEDGDRIRVWVLDGEYAEPIGAGELIEARPLASISIERSEFVSWLQATYVHYSSKPV